MTKTVKALGKTFTVSENATTEQIEEMIEDYAASVGVNPQLMDASEEEAQKEIALFSEESQEPRGKRRGVGAEAATEKRRRFLESLSPEQRQLIEETGDIESFLVGAGRGLTTIGRALGLVDEEDPVVTESFEALQEARPSAVVGELVGETAPFIAPATVISGIASTGGRALATGALGASEGALITRGRGADVSEQLKGAGVGGAVASGLEVGIPIVGRAAGSLFRRITGRLPNQPLITEEGLPSSELTEVLDSQGLSFDDVLVEARGQMEGQGMVDIPQAERQARFEALGAPYTRGDITQDFGQQKIEAQLLESQADEVGEPLRQLRLEQSRAIQNKMDEMMSESGVPEDVGADIKDALSGRKKLLQEEKTALYSEAFEAADELSGVPIDTSIIFESIPEPKKLARLARREGSQIKAVEDLLVEFGVIRDENKIADFVSRGNEVDTLNVSNFEDFRQELNALERADKTGATTVVTAPLKEALDETGNLVFDALEDANITDSNVLDLFKEARDRVTELKTEFSPNSISGKLTGKRPDKFTDVVEASGVLSNILPNRNAPEVLDRVMSQLEKAPKGDQAVRSLQSGVFLDFLKSSFGAESRKISGERVFSPNAFIKRYDTLGEERLSKVFKTNPEALKVLKNIRATASDLSIPAGAMPKGSASVIGDFLRNMGVTAIAAKTGITPIIDVINVYSKRGQDKRFVEKAIKAKPEMIEAEGFIAKELPALAAVLGVASVTQANEDEQ